MEHLSALVLLLDDVSQQIPDQIYVDAMALLGCIHSHLQQPVLTVAGECRCPAGLENTELRERNTRLKHTLRNRQRRWNRLREILLDQIDELSGEIAYLEQFLFRVR